MKRIMLMLAAVVLPVIVMLSVVAEAQYYPNRLPEIIEQGRQQDAWDRQYGAPATHERRMREARQRAMEPPPPGYIYHGAHLRHQSIYQTGCHKYNAECRNRLQSR